MLNYQTIISEIQNHNHILIICHRSPDPDTVGAGGALAFYINKLPNKKADLSCIDEFPKDLDYLNLTSFYTNLKQVELENYDLIIIIDCSNIEQTGIENQILNSQIQTINIDHHKMNNSFAKINLVELMSSSSEIIYKIFKNNHIEIDKQMSTCLLTGIIYDTSFFTNSSTTDDSLFISSELIKLRADMQLIVNNVWRNKSVDLFKIWGKILSQLHFNEKYKIAVAVIPPEYSMIPEMFKDLKNYFLMYLQEVNFIILLREVNGEIHCSTRTIKDNVDLKKFTGYFGGGGHKKASGFAFKGKLQKTETGWKII